MTPIPHGPFHSMIAQPQPGISALTHLHGSAAAGLPAQDIAPDIAAFSPRDRVEAGLAEQLVLLGAVLRDGCGRMFSPDLPTNLAPRMLGAVTSLAREIRAVTLMLIRRQAEPLPYPEAMPDDAEGMLPVHRPGIVAGVDAPGQDPGHGLHSATGDGQSRPRGAAGDPTSPDGGADPDAAGTGQGAVRHEPARCPPAIATGRQAAGAHGTGLQAAGTANSSLVGAPRHQAKPSIRASLLSQAACVDAMAGLSPRPVGLLATLPTTLPGTLPTAPPGMLPETLPAGLPGTLPTVRRQPVAA